MNYSGCQNYKYAIEIEDNISLGPDRVDVKVPDGEFGFEGTLEPWIQRDHPPERKPYIYICIYIGRRCRQECANEGRLCYD